MNGIRNEKVEALTNRLAFALAGTHGRTVSAASLRSLASVEISEWKSDAGLLRSDPKGNIPLIAGRAWLAS
jgi:hypothetical protein